MSAVPTPAPTRHSRVYSATGGVGRWVRGHRFTSAVAALILLLAMAAHPLFGHRAMLRWDMGTGYEPLLQQGHWWSPVTSVFFTSSLIDLVVVLILTVALLGVAEWLMGTGRTALVFFATATIGPLAGVGLQLLGMGSGEFWSRHVAEMVALDPLTATAGALLAASGFASVLWRRRIRILTLLVLLVFLLYSGQPADLYRLLAGIAGLLAGMLLRKEKRGAHWLRSSAHEVRVLSAAFVAITAIGPVIALLAGSHFGPLAPVALLLGNQVPDAVGTIGRCQAFAITTHCVRDLTLERIDSPGAVLLSVTPLILLLLAAYGLLRGRRFAVWLAGTVNGLLGILSAFYFGLLPVAGLPYVIKRPTADSWEASFGIIMSAVLPLAIAVALIVLRKRFPVLASRSSIRRYLIAVAVAAAGLAALYVIGGLLVRDTAFTSSVNLADLLGDVVERFIPVSFLRPESIAFLPTTMVGGLLYYGIGPVFWTVVIIAAIRPIRDSPARQQPGALTRARSLLVSGGGDSLTFMACWPNNSYWFDTEENFAIGYRLVGRIALTIGGPFGSTGPKDAAIARFARYCDDNDWIPVFYSIDSSFDGLFRSMGWHSMVVAEETVLRPATWQTTGKKWQDVRTYVNRAQRAGITATWTPYAALSVGTAAQLTEISELWVADKGLPEMGFTLGGLDELRDPAVALMLAVDQDGQVQAVTSWLPIWRHGNIVGWTLDFMRRRPDSINGVMEFLIAETAIRMREAGINYLSLSGAPLAHTAGLPEDAPAIDQILAYLSTSLEPVYGFRSLLNFKRKFQPEFHPLLMAYPDPAALPAIGLALARAYLPGLSIGQISRLARSAG
ncbi:MAG: DUF2156 domain-containing protein [Microbacteriaceae bacterium]|nr:MAG: DUF2156 domain-containing protein [Microbacteriaceae bacterium]